MDQLPFPLPLYLQQPGKGARGEPQVPPVDLPAANQEYSIIFAAACTWRKYLDLAALGGDTSDRSGVPAKTQRSGFRGERKNKRRGTSFRRRRKRVKRSLF